MNPKMSVIMPVYNEEKHLGESIQSMLNQTFRDFELIIVNDCSTDNSLNIIKKYLLKDNRIKLINLKNNKGVSLAKNSGLEIAKGKYIAILDGDDLSHPKRLEKQFNYLEKNSHIFLVGSSAIYVDENGEEIRKFRKYDNYKMVAWRLPTSCSIVNSSVMFRNENKLYNNHFKGASDYDFYLNLLVMGKNLTNLPDFLTKYRVHKGSMSISNEEEQNRLANETREKHSFLKNKTNRFYNLIYMIKSLLFYLRTFSEKRVRKN